MNERKLTGEQINQLFELCEFHSVNYYDVQVELVDHLASAIEEIWKTNPDMPFEEAVFSIGEKFGVDPYFQQDSESLLPTPYGRKTSKSSGFEAIKEAKETELRRKYERLQWKYILEFFRLPKIVLTILSTSILILIFQVTHFSYIFNFGLLVLFFLASFVFLLFYFPRKIQMKIEEGKSFLLLEQFKICHWHIVYLAVFPTLNVFIWGNLLMKHIDSLSSMIFFWELVAALFYVFLGIVIIVYGFYLPERIKEDFTREFPQFVKS